MTSEIQAPPRSIGQDFLARLASLVLAKRKILLVLTILLIHFLLISPSLMPAFNEINMDDEAKYIESGWRLLREGPRELAWGPLVSFVYAPVHLLVGGSPNWFMIEAWVGGFFLFFLLWLSAYTLALQFKEYFHPLITVGVLFVSTYFVPIIENPSDALFVSMSAFALSRVIAFYRGRELQDILLASFFVGLGVLCRVETILLVGTLAFITVVIGRRYHSFLKMLASTLLPAVGILAVFFLTSLLTKGHLNLGTGEKAYDAFTMGQPTLHVFGDPAQEAASPFGTKEENRGSIFAAIVRHPDAFANRILGRALEQPGFFLDVYGKKLGPVLLLFSLWGVYTLIKRRSLPLLLILLFWPLHTLVALAFFANHIVPQTSYVPVILSAIGIAAVFRSDLPRRESVFLFLTSLSITFASLLFNKPAILVGGLILTAVLALTWLIQPRAETTGSLAAVPLLILLAAGFVLRGSYLFPNFPALGSSVDEQAVTYILQEFKPLSKLLTTSPYQMLAARMEAVEIQDVPADIVSPQQLSQWLEEQDIQAVYLDNRSGGRPDVAEIIESGQGEQFEVGFASEDDAVRIFVLRNR